jgi:hypothetical protein
MLGFWLTAVVAAWLLLVAATRDMVQSLVFGRQDMLTEPALDQYKLERKVMETGQLIPRKPLFIFGLYNKIIATHRYSNIHLG